MRLSFPSRRISAGIILFVTAAIAFAVTAVSMSGNRSTQGSGQFLIDNKTPGFTVEKAERDGDLLRLALRNQYDKNIKAYTVGIGDVTMEEDFIYSDRVIAPREVFMLELPRHPRSWPTGSLRISLLAVVFEDGTSDGLMANYLAIKDRRLGERLQFKRIILILQALIDSSDDETSKLVQLKTRAASLPEEAPFSRAFKSGLHGGRESLLQIVKRLEQPSHSGQPVNFREQLQQLKQEFEDKISKVID